MAEQVIRGPARCAAATRRHGLAWRRGRGGLRYANPPCDCAFGADGNGELEVPMARYLKRGMDASAIKAADAKVRETGRGRPRASRDRARRGGARAVAECRTIQ